MIFPGTAGRRIFIYLTKGRLSVNSKEMGSGDPARIDMHEPLIMKASDPADLILIDIPSCKGWGYSQEILQGRKK